MTARPKLICALILVPFLLFNACKKSNSPSGASITSITPATLWAGDTIIFHGRNFGTDPSKITISLNEDFPLAVLQAHDTIVAAVLPSAGRLAYFGGQTFDLIFSLAAQPYYSKTFTVTVVCPEPKGWFKVFASTTAYNNLALQPVGINFPSDSTGLLFAANMSMISKDGGETWQQTSDAPAAYGTCLYALDSSHVWIGGQIDNIYSSSDAGNSWSNYATFPLTTTYVLGVYMSSPTSGQYLNGFGQLYSITGSPGAATSTLEYQSQWLGGNYIIWQSLSNVDQNNLMLGGINGVAVKTNGVYDEYQLPAPAIPPIVQVQLLNTNLGYALDWKNNLLQYTGNRNWSKLSQQGTAFWFTSATTGYIADSQHIYQTNDGGQAWTPVFALTPGDVVYAFCAHNGKIWAIGSNGTTTGFIYKYNP